MLEIRDYNTLKSGPACVYVQDVTISVYILKLSESRNKDIDIDIDIDIFVNCN
jgi:hypothetical protein